LLGQFETLVTEQDMVRRKMMPKLSGKSRSETPDDYLLYVTTKFVSRPQFFWRAFASAHD